MRRGERAGEQREEHAPGDRGAQRGERTRASRLLAAGGLEPHREPAGRLGRYGGRPLARFDGRVVLHRGRLLSLLQAELRLEQLLLEVSHFAVLQLDLLRRAECRPRGRPEGDRRGCPLVDAQGGLGRRRGEHRQACGRRRRREGRRPGYERRHARALDDDLLELGDLLLVSRRQPIGIHDRVALLLQDHGELSLQPGDRAPEESQLLVALAHLLDHRGAGAEARLSRVRAELHEVVLVRSGERRVDVHNAGARREVMDGLLRLLVERVLDVDHVQPVDRPVLEGDLDLDSEHHVEIVGQG